MTATASTPTLDLTTDDIYPRDEDHRYRLYGRTGDNLDVLCASPNMAGIGVAIGQMHEDQKSVGRRLADLGQIGVLDVLAGPKGEWIVNPFQRA